MSESAVWSNTVLAFWQTLSHICIRLSDTVHNITEYPKHGNFPDYLIDTYTTAHPKIPASKSTYSHPHTFLYSQQINFNSQIKLNYVYPKCNRLRKTYIHKQKWSKSKTHTLTHYAQQNNSNLPNSHPNYCLPRYPVTNYKTWRQPFFPYYTNYCVLLSFFHNVHQSNHYTFLLTSDNLLNK